MILGSSSSGKPFRMASTDALSFAAGTCNSDVVRERVWGGGGMAEQRIELD